MNKLKWGLSESAMAQPKSGIKDFDTGVQKKNENVDLNQVIVTDISMPFSSMVVFMIKWSIASIPACLIIYIFYYVLFEWF